MTRQRYVSKELTHFVGKGLATEDEQYALLVKILKCYGLTHWPHDPNESGNIEVFPERSVGEMYNPQVVCFADIPVFDLDIHIEKYSPFGLSFLKSFLIEKGANPVFYVANESRIKSYRETEAPDGVDVPRKDYYENMYREWLALYDQLSEIIRNARLDLGEEFWDLHSRLFHMNMFLQFHFFSFAKHFDAARADEDPANFYMEREWRIVGNVSFELKDVYRIILPRAYSKRLREDLPDYVGQVTFPEP